MPKKSVFLVFEGGDGVGKTTQVTLLQEEIEARWGPCVRTREPGGSMYAEEIRNVILHSDYAGQANAFTMFELFWAARRDHMGKTSRPITLMNESLRFIKVCGKGAMCLRQCIRLF